MSSTVEGTPSTGRVSLPVALVVTVLLVAAAVSLAAKMLVDQVDGWWWLVFLAGAVGGGVEVLRSLLTTDRPAVADRPTVPRGLPDAPPGLPSLDAPEQSAPMVLEAAGAALPPGSVSNTSQWAPQSSIGAGSAEGVGLAPIPGQSVATTGDGGLDVVRVPKSSSSAEEIEDGWAGDLRSGRVALADGASSAFMAKEWAATITGAFVSQPLRPTALRTWLADATRVWQQVAEQHLAAQTGPAGAGTAGGQWWVGASQARGSHATLVGLELGPTSKDGRAAWRSVAVGDSCVVHLAKGTDGYRPLVTFPVEHAGGFGGHPDLLPTVAEEQVDLPPVREIVGECRSGDVFVLVTDALAHWLAQNAGEPGLWDWLVGVQQGDFAAFVDDRRSAGELHDDDTTVVRVVVPEPSS